MRPPEEPALIRVSEGPQRDKAMKEKIHPAYQDVTVTCGCGESFKTRSTRTKIGVEICSKCHPFYTGKQKFVDTAGMVEKFQRKYTWSVAAIEERKKAEGARKAAETAAKKEASDRERAERSAVKAQKTAEKAARAAERASVKAAVDAKAAAQKAADEEKAAARAAEEKPKTEPKPAEPSPSEKPSAQA